jgi:hypothetical protein
MNCSYCKGPLRSERYRLTFGDEVSYNVERSGHFCSRLCVVRFIAPELSEAVVVKQWVPTPEEEERMRQ